MWSFGDTKPLLGHQHIAMHGFGIDAQDDGDGLVVLAAGDELQALAFAARQTNVWTPLGRARQHPPSLISVKREALRQVHKVAIDLAIVGDQRTRCREAPRSVQRDRHPMSQAMIGGLLHNGDLIILHHVPEFGGVGVTVAIPPTGKTAVPVGVPKTGFMIESMVTATARNIGALLRGKEAVEQAKHGFRKLARDVATEWLGRRTPEQERLALDREARRHGPTRLDPMIAAQAPEAGVRLADLRAPSGDPDLTQALKARVRELQRMGLAEETSRNVFRLSSDWRERLKAMELHLDIRKRVMRERMERNLVQHQRIEQVLRKGFMDR
jgi:hypothetical protein